MAACEQYCSETLGERGGEGGYKGQNVSIRFLSPLKCFFQFSIMFILFKPGTSRSFISFVHMYFL